MVELCQVHLFVSVSKEFFSEWVRVGTESEGLYHDHLNSGVATPLHWSNAPRDSPEREAKFKARIVQARHAFTLLNSYVRERFPDLDLRELDAGGERRYYEWVERIDREVAEITERLIKKQTDVEVEPTDERPLSVI